jgi:hypothetical protein
MLVVWYTPRSNSDIQRGSAPSNSYNRNYRHSSTDTDVKWERSDEKEFSFKVVAEEPLTYLHSYSCLYDFCNFCLRVFNYWLLFRTSRGLLDTWMWALGLLSVDTYACDWLCSGLSNWEFPSCASGYMLEFLFSARVSRRSGGGLGYW